MDAEAADFTRMRGMEGTPIAGLARAASTADEGCAVEGVAEDKGCLGREPRFSFRTTILTEP